MKLFVQLKWFFIKKWRRYIGAILLLISISLLQLISPKLVGMIIDHIIIKKKSFFYSIQWLGLIIIVSIIIYGLRYIWRILLFGAAYQLAIELRDQLYHFLSVQSSRFYLCYRTGDLMARATNDVDFVVFAAGEGVLTLVDSLVISCSVLIIMSYGISLQLTILSMLPMPIMVYLIRKIGQRLHKRFRVAQSAFSMLSNQVQENLSSIRMIKAFGLEKYRSSKFFSVVEDVNCKNIKVAKIDAQFDPIIYFCVGLSNLLAVIGGGWLVFKNMITLGQLTSFIMYLGLMIWPMLAFGWMLNIVERGSAAYERIREMLKEKIDLKDGYLSIPNKTGLLQVFIKKFYYPSSERRNILDNVQFTLLPGRTLGICGPTGSGKSTILSLILRQFDISYGEIKFNNLPIRKIFLNEWRSRLSWVDQKTFLFSGSIASNICFGKPKSSMEKIEEVARLACVHEDIIKFPQGYQTEIGEKGVMLSGGQKQRLAIARALLLKSEILILDNALSAIDIETEYLILRNLRVLNKKQTTIIVTNNLLSLKEADEILVIQNGKIIQRGNFSFLIKKSGWYRNVCNF